MYKKVFILFIVLFLVSCSKADDTRNIEQKEIEINSYKPDMGEYSVSYLIDASTKGSSSELKEKNLLYIPKDEAVKISFGSSNLQDKGHKIIMKVFYDYKSIDFKLKDNDNFTSEYILNIENNTKIDISIYLDDKDIDFDKNIHKLLVTFSTGYTQHASDLNLVTDSYGLSANFDVVHDLKYKDHVVSYPYDSLKPENNFDIEYGNLIINTDYNNKTQKSEYGGVLNPPPLLKVKRSTILPLMYNMNKYKSENALIILTLNYDQIDVDGKYAELIKLDRKDGTANGVINIETPKSPGKYELIGYVIHDPYQKYSGGSNLVYTSYRFTLEVE